MRFKAIAAFFFLLANASAVILFRTGDPNENTTPPTGLDANSGWQYEGTWGGFLGTAIAPHFFISAAHIGMAGAVFTYQNVDYHVVGQNYDPQSDFVIWEVAEQLPFFAPLYTRMDEVGQRIIAIGRGTQRGNARFLNSVLKGWDWGAGDGVQRWGENIVASIYHNGPNNDLLRAEFNENGLPNECHLSVGDSGGAAFLNDNGTWKLGGIHYAVDGPFYLDADGTGQFNAALFDMSGYFQQDNQTFTAVAGPSAFYPTRISTKLGWIGAKIARVRIAREGNYITLTFTKIVAPSTDVIYTVQQSIDGIAWQTATTIDEIISNDGGTQQVKSKVDMTSQANLLLRVQVERP